MFTRLQSAIQEASPRVRLSLAVHNEIDEWRDLLHHLATRPNHFRELIPFLTNWYGAHGVANSGMGGVFFAPIGEA